VSDEHPVAEYGGLIDQMDNRTLDLMPAWSGELLGQLDPSASGRTSEDVYNQLNQALPQGISAGDPTTVQNKPLVFVSNTLATATGVDELAECSRLPAGLALVTVAEPAPQTLADLGAAGCVFGPTQVLDTEAAVAEVAAGRAAGLFSALGVVSDDAGLQGLDDGADALRAQDLVPIYRTAGLTRTLLRAVNKVAGELTTADLTAMSAEVDGGADLSGVASRWLGEHSI
jgi:osmoprotectant transport system substrate-binding protein